MIYSTTANIYTQISSADMQDKSKTRQEQKQDKSKLPTVHCTVLRT